MRNILFISFLLTALVAVSFWGVRWHPFSAFDDSIHITENQYMQPPSLAKTWFFWRFPFDRTPVQGIRSAAGSISPPYEAIYAPLAFTTWSALTYFARDTTTEVQSNRDVPLDASIYHSFNLLLHLINALLVFFLVRRLVKNDWCALGGALLFGVHPAQVEAVAWVTGMNNLLGAFWSLLALHWYLDSIQAGTEDGRTKLGWFLGALLAFLLAMLSKPSSVPLPLLAYMLALVVQPRHWRKRGLQLGSWLAVALVMVLVNQSLNQMELVVAVVEWFQRPLLIGDAFSFYIGKVLLPLQLLGDYGRKPAWVLQQTWSYFAWLVPLLLTIGVWKLCVRRARAVPDRRQQWHLILGGWLVFLLTLLPTSGIITFYFHLISTVADRYLYVALIPLSLSCGAMLELINGRIEQKFRPLLVGICVGVAACWCALSYRQVNFWSSDTARWGHTLQHNDRSVTALGILAGIAGRQNNWTQVKQYAERGLELEPGNWRLLGYQGAVLRREGKNEEALVVYKRSLEAHSGFLAAQLAVGELLQEKGDSKGAIQAFGEALKINPDQPVALIQFGLLAAKMGSPKIAEEHLRKALQMRANPGVGHTFLGIALAQQGKFDEALDELNLALAFNDNLYEAHFNRSLLLERNSDTAGALQAMRRALALKEDFLPTYLALARLEWKAGNKDIARRLWRAALARDPKNKVAQEGLRR